MKVVSHRAKLVSEHHIRAPLVRLQTDNSPSTTALRTLIILHSIKMTESPSFSKKEDGMNGLKFWAIFAALSFTNLLAGLEGSIAATALPSVVSDLQAGDNYVWIVNGYMLT